MSQEAVESFIGRIVTDDKFRNEAVVSLEQACLHAGLQVSAREIGCLKELNYRFLGLFGETVDAAIRRY